MTNKLEMVILRSPKFRKDADSWESAKSETPMATTSSAGTSKERLEEHFDSLSISVDEVTPSQVAALSEEEDVHLVPQMPFVLPASVPFSSTAASHTYPFSSGGSHSS